MIVNGGRELVDYFLELAERAGDGKLASNWLQQDVMRAAQRQGDHDRRVPRVGRGGWPSCWPK
ncbi:MAG: hypothetical protein R3C10_24825 [Pirellulales bacterium]